MPVTRLQTCRRLGRQVFRVDARNASRGLPKTSMLKWCQLRPALDRGQGQYASYWNSRDPTSGSRSRAKDEARRILLTRITEFLSNSRCHYPFTAPIYLFNGESEIPQIELHAHRPTQPTLPSVFCRLLLASFRLYDLFIANS